ncbi:hypothetical protein CFK38_10275 [Brachybacterium vulturis]|uniref:Putative Flp pilus-assembly TadG-like N-terminal domain-containing protein n=1 Tax=Brachybacterium vulturis TaxID=2017484 RepID=A0A291GPF2_9MICO|nr:pilus assembly protein TadG-related protein [Brachybacterium vulturis]ATG51866.1 hypothetical protein CFK38_10275 [Brachybacterium vulturis]
MINSRLREERGASSAIVALFMVVILLVAAVVIDIAAMQLERQQLQTGADAAALAIAQDCAHGDCGDAAATAESFVGANRTYGGDDDTLSLAAIPDASSGTVTVRASSPSQHFFAPIIGIDESVVGASATARWGAPSGGTLDLPLIFSWCDFMNATDQGTPSDTTTYTLALPKHGSEGCVDQDGTALSGGFGWLDPDAASCTLDATIYEDEGDAVGSDPGSSKPKECGADDFAAIQGRTILLPVFVETRGTGSNGEYKIYGFAAFRVTGYAFDNKHTCWNMACNGGDKIQGHLVDYIAYDGSVAYDPDAPNLGTVVVRLVSGPEEDTP